MRISDWCWAFGIAAIMICVVFMLLLLHQHPIDEHDGFRRVDDAPLLTARQAWEARATGYATFWIGSEYYVAEEVPKNYVDFSAWRTRME